MNSLYLRNTNSSNTVQLLLQLVPRLNLYPGTGYPGYPTAMDLAAAFIMRGASKNLVVKCRPKKCTRARSKVRTPGSVALEFLPVEPGTANTRTALSKQH
eukprot:3723175-Rhodomonas_salina.1